MSHTIRVKKVNMSDKEAIKAAVAADSHAHFVAPGNPQKVVGSIEEATGSHHLYGGNRDGIGVMLEGWNYPVVINPGTGEASYDNFGGSWGEEDRIDELVQSYCTEKTRLEAMIANINMAREEVLDDGTVEMEFHVFEQYTG